ncbi:linalool dehydratase/isomerase domain-containing protein [Nocardioides stalactiti]|uniref:linalool dehydratase/isomerase domain-containing protein n=1 Tax=Nocardioides stalactiti TaxID=2755356 RepID=UPI0015FFD2BD|nr:hypothetical protein [Nocardioides stalactiti]
MTTMTTDQTVRLLLPTHTRALPPVTARRQRRAILTYGALWALGALPGLLDLGAAWTAAGLGLALPGGGLLWGGHPVLAVAAVLVLVLSVFTWWATGPTVLPPLVWLGTAGLGAALADPGSSAAQTAALVAGPALVVAAAVVHRFRHARQVRAGARLNERLAEVDFVITGPPGLDVRVPVAEHTEADLAHLRYGLDLALQPLDSFEGFTRIDQFREAATRYQLNALGYGLAMSQFTRTPAFSGYLAEAQRNAIEKMLDRRIWGYWALENAWGNLDLDRDPVDNGENIMLTGFHGLMVGMYESLNDDRYSRPGALTYRWDGTTDYANDYGTLASSIHRNVQASPFALFPCEPNWIYTVCNTFGMNTMRSHDRLHGTDYFTAVEDRLRTSYENEFLRPDGRIIGVRSSHLGLSWNLWAGPSIQITTSYWMHAALPDIARRTWWLLREHDLRRDSGTVTTRPTVSARLDPGNYQLGTDTYSQVVTLMAAREHGDEDLAAEVQRGLDEQQEIAEADGARRYANASGLANLYSLLGRYGRHSALRDLVVFGAPEAWRAGPRLAEAAYPDVLVAKAVTDGRALDLVLRPGASARRTVVRVDRLVPGHTYDVHGALLPTCTAGADGTADLEIDLDGRLEVRVAPRG